MRKRGNGTKVLISAFEELITSRLPWRVRHTIFVLYQRPFVLRSADNSLETNRQLWEKSRLRWVNSEPNNELTWGEEISGDNFVRKAVSHNAFDSNKNILEIGPGKGRILKSLIDLRIPYKEYFGVDISKKNIEYLHKNFNARHRFIEGDIETIQLEKNFDIILSSLTFKHMFPSFKKTLLNISKNMNLNAMMFFDLPEGNLKCFHRGAFIRWYSKSEVKNILKECNLQVIALDYVKHTPWHRRRLFVVAKSPLACC
jgi:SAM-dependent methyltransferase